MRSLSAHALLTILVSISAFFSMASADSPLYLGLAQPYAILAGSTVTSTGTVGTVITGNIGIFPGTALTGFPPGVLNGALDSANGASGSAQGDLTTAYNVLAAKATTQVLSDIDLGGMTLLPGVYTFAGTAAMNGQLTLDAGGNAAAIWTFQVGSSLLIAEGSSIIFKDSIGNPDYVYWQVGTSATLAKGVPMIGNILALASVVVNDGVTVKGRCLARNAAVTLDRSVITMPTVRIFRAKQKLSGVSLEQYNNNPALNSDTTKKGVADSMTGVLPSDVQKFSVATGPSSAARSDGPATAVSTESVILEYIVSVSSETSVEDLQAELATSVGDTSFTYFLHTAASDNGAVDLAGAYSDSIDTEAVTTDSSDSSDSSTLSDGAIAGIVIGGFVGLVLIAMIIFFFTCHASSHKAAAVPGQQA